MDWQESRLGELLGKPQLPETMDDETQGCLYLLALLTIILVLILIIFFGVLTGFLALWKLIFG